MKFASIRLTTRDVPALSTFYERVTGITPSTHPQFAGYAEVRFPSFTLALASQGLLTTHRAKLDRERHAEEVREEGARRRVAEERVRIARNLIDRREEIELITHPDILVIEDDVQLQTTIEAAFEDEGLQPAIAATGEEAVTLLKSDLSDYHALVVDIRLLGRIDGWEVARTARRIDPNFPVVYITGAAAERWQTQGVLSSVLFKKPFALADLVTVVRQLLDEGSSGEP